MAADTNIDVLTDQFFRTRDLVARAGTPHFDPSILKAASSGNVFLCGHNPVLAPLNVYLLLRERFAILGIADDDIEGQSLLRHTVISSRDLEQANLPSDALLLNCSSHNRQSYDIFQTVAARINKPIINPQQLAFIAPQIGKQINQTICPDYFVKSILDKGERYLSVLPLLQDEASRRILLQVLLGRLTINFNWFWEAYSSVEDMYFPDFFECGDDEVFVDAGAYDGKDTDRFLRRRNYQFKACYLFEIAPSNLKQIDRTLDNLPSPTLRERIHVIPEGLWHEKDRLDFCGEGLFALLADVQLSEIEQSKVAGTCKVTDLDSVIDRATLIKFEIEGAELPALKGARRILTDHRPKLAISAYHLSDDILDIVEFLRSLDLGYQFRLRHHWGSEIRTVIYAATHFRQR